MVNFCCTCSFLLHRRNKLYRVETTNIYIFIIKYINFKMNYLYIHLVNGWWDTERKENFWLCLYHPFEIYILFSPTYPLLSIHISQQAKFTAFTTLPMGKDWVISMCFLFGPGESQSNRLFLSLPDSNIISNSKVADLKSIWPFFMNLTVLFWKVQGYESPSDVDMHKMLNHSQAPLFNWIDPIFSCFIDRCNTHEG